MYICICLTTEQLYFFEQLGFPEENKLVFKEQLQHLFHVYN